MKITAAAFALFTSLMTLSAHALAADPWEPLQFLVGSWKGDGKAEGASGQGGTVFTWEVGHQLLVRRDRTEYAATATQPAFTYEALMVIYKDSASGEIEADYFDSGNHTIHYKLTVADKPNCAQFISDAPTGPTFRLTYVLRGVSELSGTFDVRPPGDKTTFQTVAAGVMHKQ